jgi:murein DD-endopeptidase MepM/ murein hydrolase activator NlpD
MRFRVLYGVAVLVTASVFALTGRWPWHRIDGTPMPVAAFRMARPEPVLFDIRDTLRRGETVTTLFARHGLRDGDVNGLARVLDLRRLRAGLVFHLRKSAKDSVAQEIAVRTGPEQRVRLLRVADGWNARTEAIRWQPQIIRAEGLIDNSLYAALDGSITDDVLKGPERQRLAWDIADVFAWQLDFTRDVQPGDKFRLALERLVSDEGEVRFGRLLAAELEVSNRKLTAFRFVNGETAAFYDADGKSLRRSFLRAPLEFRSVSSRFSSARLHPILGILRRHEGTDYAAPPGTPVLAASDGVVVRAGWSGGYGNLVELKHRNGVTTRYGHLRSFGSSIRAGTEVLQGQVVGFVGSTGLASGPHLHYEFRVDGVPRDPTKVQMGGGAPIDAALRPAFLLERDRMQGVLDGTSSIIAPTPSVSPVPPAPVAAAN